MKKILLGLLLIIGLGLTSCKKENDEINKVEPTPVTNNTTPGLHSIRISGILTQFNPSLPIQQGTLYINNILTAGQTVNHVSTGIELTTTQVAYTNDTIHLIIYQPNGTIGLPWENPMPECDVYIDSKLYTHFIGTPAFSMIDETFIIQ